MPLYEYQCQDCLTVFEVRATFKAKEAGLEPECPHCRSRKTKQLLSAGLLIREGEAITVPTCGPNCGPGCCGG